MISKEAFISALEEVDNAILAALPDPGECSFHFSDRFEQRMRSVIRRGNHPGIYKTLQRVACVLLVLLMLFSGIMIFSTDARAAVIGWIKEQYDTFYHYFFPTETKTSEKIEYTLGWVPDGYFYLNSFIDETGETLLYVDTQDHILQFTYSFGGKPNSAFVDGETYEYYQTKVGSNSADLYISTSESASSGIIWTNSQNYTLFWISGILESDELIMIAENVIEK